LVGALWFAGCSSAPEKPKLVLTGNVLVDGPNAIANGPPRDKVLWQYRTAAAAMRQGQYVLAKQCLDDALVTLQGIYSGDPSGKKARGYFSAEAKKNFIGEPYERAMAYIYRGILYWMDGEPDNARACFRSAELEDADTENKAYSGDWVMADYLDGLATEKLHGDGANAFKRAQASAKDIKLPPYAPDGNLLCFVEFGPGPRKYAAGQYGEQLKFTVNPSPVHSARLTIGSLVVPIAPVDDVSFQATTRGGRVMDHILGNKAVFKSTTDTIGTAALIGGLGTAAFSDNRTAQQVGLGIALAGLIGKAISAATTPAADTRAWDNLPRYLSFACLPLQPGKHQARVDFLDASGNALPNFTKTVNFEVSADGKDKVLFVSDQSPTPQNL
jgi:hypothetical protein